MKVFASWSLRPGAAKEAARRFLAGQADSARRHHPAGALAQDRWERRLQSF